jgi:hypothetical protein
MLISLTVSGPGHPPDTIVAHVVEWIRAIVAALPVEQQDKVLAELQLRSARYGPVPPDA